MDPEAVGSSPTSCTNDTILFNKKVMKKKLKTILPSGFKDTDNEELILREALIEIIKRNFQLYGFEQIDTSSFEFLENVADTYNKETSAGIPTDDIFYFQNRPDSGVRGNETSTIALRPDLTKSLARYTAKNNMSLSKPFKRFQIGTVWRDELKPNTKGKMREFIQIDSDVVGTKNINADADMIILLADTIQKCQLNKDEYIVKFSNRKLILGLLNSLGVNDDATRLNVIRTCDKFSRLPQKDIIDLLSTGRKDPSGEFLKGCNLLETQIKKILEFLETMNLNSLDKICDDPLFQEGIRELKELIKIINLSSYSKETIFSPSLMRGNEYYTSTIFEANLFTKTKKGETVDLEYAIGGGGRYDQLVEKYTENSIPGVGLSIGLSRLLLYLRQLKKKINTKISPPVVILVFDQNLMPDYKKILELLRSDNINSEIYYGDGNIKSQMKYADWRNSPACLLYGENEAKEKKIIVKNLTVGKKSSEEIKSREEWKENKNIQVTVEIENLLNEIRKIIPKDI